MNHVYRIFTIYKNGDKLTTCKKTDMQACCTLEINGKEQEKLVNMFKALGNPIRFEIMKFLLTHPGCITGDIVEYLPIAQATVSQHLKVLREAGLITGSIEGTATNYCLNSDIISWFKNKIQKNF